MMQDHKELAMHLIRQGLAHYDAGGGVNGPTTTNGGQSIEGGFHTLGGIQGEGPVGQGINDTTGKVTSATMNGIGGVVQGVGSAFTNQNQYQAGLAPTSQYNFLPAFQTNAANQSNVAGQQQGLAQQLLAQSQGQGPNPAASMLTSAQGQNAAQAAGVYANNRAINPALAARQSSMIQAQGNQTAANTAATLRAQQQLAAQGQLAQQQQNLAGNNLAAQGQLLGANAAQNTNQVQNYGQAQGINAQIAQNNSNAVNKTTGSMLGGASSLLALLNKGGMVKGYANGGDVDDPSHPSDQIENYGSSAPVPIPDLSKNQSADDKKGGGLPGLSSLTSMMKSGGKVQGKADVKGDSVKNDTVPALLSPGEIVVPRTSASDPEKAKEFIDHIMKKQGTTGGYGEMKAKHRELAARIAELEKRLGKKAS